METVINESLSNDPNEFLIENKNLVYHTLKAYSHLKIEQEELFQVGLIGLYKAYAKFDPEKGYKFSTYAVPSIKGEIQRYLRDTGLHSPLKVSRSIIDLSGYMYKNELMEKSDEEIADLFDEKTFGIIVTKERVQEAKDYSRLIRNTKSMDSVFHESSDGDDLTWKETLASNDSYSQFDTIYINDFLSRLSERDRIVAEMTSIGSTQREIGDKLGVTQVQVSRILGKLKERLHYYLNSEETYEEYNSNRERKIDDFYANTKGDLELMKRMITNDHKHSLRSISKESGCNIKIIYDYLEYRRDNYEGD